MQDKQTSLTITHTQLSSSKIVNEIAELNLQPKLGTFTSKDTDKLKQLDNVLVVIGKSIGTETFDKDVRLNTISFLIEHYPDFSIEEVKKAINLSIANSVDCYGKFTLQFISKCLNDYKDKRKEILFDLKKQSKIEPEVKPPTQKELYTMIISNLQNIFDIYREKKELNDYGNITYNLLEKLGAINLSIEEKQTIYEQAKKELSKNLTLEKIKHGNELFKLAFDKMIKEIRQGNNKEIIFEAKRKALAMYFDEMIKNSIPITKLINDCNERINQSC